MVKLVRRFFHSGRGNLLQVIIAVIVVGALSYHFWTGWGNNMSDAGTLIKTRLEKEQWLN